MAAVSMLSHRQRKKPATYGKSSREADPWSIDRLNALRDEEKHATSKAMLKRPLHSTESDVSDRPISRPRALKPVIAAAKAHDTWDVPSDDDPLSPIRTTSPSKFTSRQPLSRVTQEAVVKLAPWEEKKQKRRKLDADNQSTTSQTSRGPQDSVSPEAQLNWELSADVARTEETARKAPPVEVKTKTKSQRSVSTTRNSPPVLSAAARLQARRLMAGSKTQSDTDGQSKTRVEKRTQIKKGGSGAVPRKRARERVQDVGDVGDILVDSGGARLPNTGKSNQSEHKLKSADMEIYNLSESSADECKVAEPISKQRLAPLNDFTRERLKAHRKPLLRCRGPAAGRSSKVIQSDSETPNATTRSPSVPSSTSDGRPSTPPRNTSGARPLNAPPKKRGDNNVTMKDDNVGLTPKQAQIWGQLLPRDRVMGSPSILPLNDLNISSNRKTTNLPPARRRTRLVDRLKASAPSSDNEFTDSSEEETGDEIADAHSNASAQDIAMADEPSTSQTSQSRSQNALLAEHGSKITYAKSRSYLQEESFEDGLMFELTNDSPPRPAAPAAPPASQASAFDLEDSDDEHGAGRMRTVHELRAGGGNQRFMDEFGGLLEDVADHRSSARSRRRGAIVDIGVKLLDPAFVEKIFRQGFEQQLLTECAAPFDDVANFALAMAFVAMLVGEPSRHVVQSFRDGGLITWLVVFLESTTDPQQLIRDRANGMSRAAQTSFLGFVDKFAQQQSLWGDHKPELVTLRLVSLKALDQLIRQLRRLGEKVECIGLAEVDLLLLNPVELSSAANVPLEMTLAVSILESVSTSALALTWRANLMERLATIITSLPTTDRCPDHLLFLTMRLCMNLTNDNVRNCRAFSSHSIVVYLLQSVRDGFDKLTAADVSPDQRAVNLDLLVLSMGILINVAEHDDTARQRSTTSDARSRLAALVEVFQQGQKRVFEAESVEESSSNVAYGYLAIVLANLCRNAEARSVIAAQMPGGTLAPLVDAVQEFVVHHQQVDTMNFAGDEGKEVWTAFTERLKGILVRLKAEAGL